MDTVLTLLGLALIVGLILFLVIASAVKMGVREALNEFKEDLVREDNSGMIDILKS